MRQEEQLREQMTAASAEENAGLTAQLERLRKDRLEMDAEIEKARAEAERVARQQEEFNRILEDKAKQEELLKTSNLVFCRAEPQDKQRLLKQLQARNSAQFWRNSAQFGAIL